MMHFCAQDISRIDGPPAPMADEFVEVRVEEEEEAPIFEEESEEPEVVVPKVPSLQVFTCLNSCFCFFHLTISIQ